MIEFGHVFKRYDRFEALKDISFNIAPGEMAFITGHSGAGKSTLLKLVTHIETPTQGSLVVNHKNLAKLKPRQQPYFRRSLGVVFQDYKLLANRSVFDNVALPLIVTGVNARETGKRTRAALEMVNLLGKEKLFPVVLSGGEQQRVGIARALVMKPPILLADEPTGNLDTALSDEILDLFLEFNQHGVTVLIASHDTRLIARAKKRVIQLKNGEIVFDTARA
jgi:cell division transport system ATP-binding protein